MGPSVGSQGRALQTPQIPEPIQDHLEASRFKEGRSQCEENHYLSFGNMDTQRIPRTPGIPRIQPEEANGTKYEPVQTWRLVEGQQIIARWQGNKKTFVAETWNLNFVLQINVQCELFSLKKGCFRGYEMDFLARCWQSE